MNEAVFPILGSALVFLVALPASAVVARILLAVCSRWESATGTHSVQGARYALIVASSALPLAWFVSASLHQAESGQSAKVCVLNHAPNALCFEAGGFSVALVTLAAVFAIPRVLREQFPRGGAPSVRSQRLSHRIGSLLASCSGLSELAKRVVVTDETAVPISTIGVFRPRVLVQSAFAETLDDEALVAALQHELEHVRGRDPLRYFIAAWALAANPLGGWLLRGELRRWVLERETHCDRGAVVGGAAPAALAHALVVAARPARAILTAALGEGHLDAVKLRVGLLLAYADRAPERCCTSGALRFVVLLLALVLFLPHHSGTVGVDAIHEISEGAVALLLGG